ncbi:MAG TPA: DeoR/GlpR transcriptional regulator [Clostridiaceae bacterium]|nr:DeoR/GlpR transcriptional regulator [Clostridiaceae bacterium]
MEKKDLLIVELLEKNGILSVKELSQILLCSEMTIRRYLVTLETKGLVKRHHGCAFLNTRARPTKFSEQMNINSREKFLIAIEAARMIRNEQVVCFDSGTTIQRMVDLLDNRLTFTAITPSLPFIESVAKIKGVKVVVPEGIYNYNNRTLELTDNAINHNINADISFISCRSFRIPVGTYEHTDTLVPTKRWLAKQSKTTVLLADSSKWQIESLRRCLTLSEIDIIITDEGVPKDSVDKLQNLGKKIVIAKEHK